MSAGTWVQPRQPATPPPRGVIAAKAAGTGMVIPKTNWLAAAASVRAIRPVTSIQPVSSIQPVAAKGPRPAFVIPPRDGRSGVTPPPGFEIGTIVMSSGQEPQKADPALAETKSENPLDCKFGRLCKRPECWFQHPEGRIIDQDPALTMCKFGNLCTRVDCFYVHPKDLDSEHFIIHIDELAMPSRPNALPSKSDREVFMDPFPHDVGSDELDSFLKSLGEYEDVYQIPHQERGYVRFKDHKGAAACVDALAGQWSESERASFRKTSRRAYGMRNQNAYPDNLVLLLRGKEAVNVKQLMDSTGVKQLRLLDGFKASDTSLSGRICFSGKGSPAAISQLKTELEELLEGVHKKFTEMLETMRSRELDVWGMPEAWAEDEVDVLFNQHGEVEKKQLLGGGHVKVVYALADDAEKAAKELDGMDMSEFGAGTLQVEMIRESREEERNNSSSVFVGNLSFEATEDDVRIVFEQIGAVPSIRMGMDRQLQKSKGYAFVDFATREDAERAINELTGLDLNGRRLRVNWADGGEAEAARDRGRKRQRNDDGRRDRGDDNGDDQRRSDEQGWHSQSWKKEDSKRRDEDENWRQDDSWRRDSHRGWGDKDNDRGWGDRDDEEPPSSRRRYGDYKKAQERDEHGYQEASGPPPPGFWGAPRGSSARRPPGPPPAAPAAPPAAPLPPAAPRVSVKRAIVPRPSGRPSGT